MRPSSKNKNKKPTQLYELRWKERRGNAETWTEMRARIESQHLRPDRLYMTQEMWEYMRRLSQEANETE